MDQQSQNEQLIYFSQYVQKENLNQTQNYSKDQSFMHLQTKRNEIYKLLNMNQMTRKEHYNRSTSNSKIKQQQNTDLNISQISNSYLINPKTHFKSFISITPVVQTKNQITSIENRGQTIQNILTKSIIGTQSANLSISKSPQILIKDQIFDNYLNKNSVYKLTKDFIKRRDLQKQNSPTIKVANRQNTENLPNIKQNDQKLPLFENNQQTLQLKSNEQNENLMSNLLNFDLSPKFSTLNTQTNTTKTQNSFLVSKNNQRNNIKVNNNCDYSTKELLIPINKIDSFFENFSKLDTEKLKNDESPKYDNLLQDNQVKDLMADSQDKSKTPMRKGTPQIRDNLNQKEKQLSILNQDTKNSNYKEVIQFENKIKKSTSRLESSKSPQIFVERQRSITTQSYLNNNFTKKIERQESLPKIEQPSQNTNNLNIFNKSTNKHQIKFLKDENKRVSIQKRLQNLMSYSVEEEFKKRFSGLFMQKQKLQKKNEVKKKVHFIIDEVL
ncbi:hypothetical protein TTHERM_01016120 (macronuclear) [Tetrahymena thermophila SB210]|uniref:Uncharacterized protein n=1 Tax=Tetrahymena thermophila (strain SB210) TaxID=312017 RepID=Q22CS9_TETTS|nr:hypothetical protein TTHERM_01016120 [Tetrahymena thermophila SB210]EAR83109.2 hypothetical protein TTHERM_01016120 [Tetrahymena thermophila SB210]|eukprot:XP_001030772.2 hypothetical protein TTHERM_01016120 [Tetrahymena thermophila SB210]